VADLDVTSAISAVEKVADGFAAGLYARFSALLNLPDELVNVQNSMAAAPTSPFFLSFEIVLSR
jgi:hypothetical protein